MSPEHSSEVRAASTRGLSPARGQALEPLPGAPAEGASKGPAKTPPRPRWGDEFDVRIERLDLRGRPRGRATHGTGDYQVILRRGAVGALVRVRTVRRRGDKLEAELVRTLEPAPGAVEPRCRHFGLCGGCSFQDVAYATQLEHKRALVQGALDQAGLAATAEPCAAAGADPWHYRNKMEYSFGRRWIEPSEPRGVESDFALGLHPARQFSKVFDLLECPIQPDPMTAVVQTARDLALALGLKPWKLKAHTGLLRHLVLRRSTATGELMVVLVTAEAAPERIRPFADALLAAHPEITTLVHSINSRAAQVAFGEREQVLHGDGHITERVAGLEFRLSPRSFFQTNSAGAEQLVRMVREEAACGSADTVLDLYCGTGLFGLALAGDAGAVRGFEVVEPAVVDARANARRNGVVNAHFEVGDVAAVLGPSGPEAAAPDVVIVDPPRAGLHPSVAPALGALAARRLVYVSCNHRAALADLEVLLAAGLELRRVRPLDLFPHTPHVECVFTLERVGS